MTQLAILHVYSKLRNSVMTWKSRVENDVIVFTELFHGNEKKERTRHLRQRTETETKCRNGKKTKKVTQMLYHPIIYSLVGAWVWFHTGLVRTSSVNSWRGGGGSVWRRTASSQHCNIHEHSIIASNHHHHHHHHHQPSITVTTVAPIAITQ